MNGHDHHTHHGHHKHDHRDLDGKNLLITVFMNFIITTAEIIGGLLSNSLALLSDAIHNFSDAIAVLIAYLAFRVGKRDSNEKQTFGYKRVEILAALFNSVTLVAICFYLFWEAYNRFLNPEPIKGTLMLIVAIIGLLANFTAMVLLRKDKNKNINIKAAYLHLVGDTLSSVAVIIGGILIILYDIPWIDPLITVLIALYILKETVVVLRETIDILMQSAPEGIDLEKISGFVEKIEFVRNIHHIHVWKLDDNSIHFECHLELEKDIITSESMPIRSHIEEFLHEEFDINHVTIQVEYKSEHPGNIISSHDV